ncbi:hypothetical protein PVAP13_6KG406700 [Panicum virgatum]|uniref:Uncharacterized protein n=1 Tax=Panicum virgatum TaxID=38727 RepID=A0A8T0RI49_PANVG|nr:hypothetical protein PVAP13_6KG406700 [Panicum virgatum]
MLWFGRPDARPSLQKFTRARGASARQAGWHRRVRRGHRRRRSSRRRRDGVAPGGHGGGALGSSHGEHQAAK